MTLPCECVLTTPPDHTHLLSSALSSYPRRSLKLSFSSNICGLWPSRGRPWGCWLLRCVIICIQLVPVHHVPCGLGPSVCPVASVPLCALWPLSLCVPCGLCPSVCPVAVMNSNSYMYTCTFMCNVHVGVNVV